MSEITVTPAQQIRLNLLASLSYDTTATSANWRNGKYDGKPTDITN